MSVIAPEVATRAFIEVTEVWVPDGDRLVWSSGNYGSLDAFAAVSAKQSFSRGEGLPGRAWDEARPVVLKQFDGSYFQRAEAARAAGLTCAVAVPIFAGSALKAVIVVLCADDESRTGAIEVWRESDGLLMLDDGYYGAARHFEWVSQHTHLPPGQGLPGGVWAANAPMLMRDLGSGYRFIRAESAGRAGLTTGLGLPITVPGDRTYVLTPNGSSCGMCAPPERPAPGKRSSPTASASARDRSGTTRPSGAWRPGRDRSARCWAPASPPSSTTIPL